MRSLFFLTIIIALVGFVVGCYSDDDGMPSSPHPVIGSVEVWMERDTVRFLYGDSVIVEGYVSVRDTSGNPVTYYPVHLYLTESVGRIEFADPQQNTTNSSGFVYFRFRSYDQSGIQTIVAECQGHADAWTLWVLGASDDNYPSLTLHADRARLTILPGQCDTVRLFVVVSDSIGQGVPDATVLLSVPCGTWQPFPPTNQAGRTETWWRVCEYGRFGLTVTCGSLMDSDTIDVVSPVASIQIWLPTDTLWILPGDSGIAEGWVAVKDSVGWGLPDAVVRISLAVPLGFIRYLNPVLRDTTDGVGRVYFAFVTDRPGVQIITAECGGHADTWMITSGP